MTKCSIYLVMEENAKCEAKHLYTKQLKKLLLECREILEDISEHTDYNEVGIENIITKIDNAIGDSDGKK